MLEWGVSDEYPQIISMEKLENYHYILVEKSALSGAMLFSKTNKLIAKQHCYNVNPCPAEPTYTLPLQTV